MRPAFHARPTDRPLPAPHAHADRLEGYDDSVFPSSRGVAQNVGMLLFKRSPIRKVRRRGLGDAARDMALRGHWRESRTAWRAVWVVLAAVWLPLGQAAAAVSSLPPLLSPQQLARVAPAVRVLDLRENAPALPRIAGSLPAAYSDWRGPADDPGRLRSVADYTALLRRLGIEADTPVVLFSAGDDPSDFGAPARVYWTLKWLGVREVSILNGGIAAWRAAGLPLQHGTVRWPMPSRFTPSPQPRWLATRQQVLGDIQRGAVERGGVRLLDARPTAFYLGQTKAPAAQRPGTLPGAVDFDNARWFPDGGGALPDVQTLRRIAQSLPGGPHFAGTTVSFCNTGHWAATNWFVLSQLLGEPDVKLYPGSMVDWSRHGGPMAHVPTRWQQLTQQWRMQWQQLGW